LSYCLSEHAATLTYYGYYYPRNKDCNPEKTALHEVLHIVLADCNVGKEHEYVEHGVVNRLVPLLAPIYKTANRDQRLTTPFADPRTPNYSYNETTGTEDKTMG